jgi:BlaI family penicillinase repressor
LTERELEVMLIFWRHGEAPAAEARDHLAAVGIDRT